MKKTFSLIFGILLSVAMLFVTVGCNGESQQPETPTVSEPTAATVPSAPQKANALQTAEAGASNLPDFKNIHTFGSSEYESYFIWNDCDMTDVLLFTIAYNDDFSDCYPTSVLSHWEIVNAGDALKLNIDIPEVVPNAALSYTAEGKQYTYILSYNGRDGGIWLGEHSVFTEADISVPAITTTSATTATAAASTKTTSPAESGEVLFSIYLMDDSAEHLLCREMTIESRSAWHAWKALKKLNPCIPVKAGLNSFTVKDGTGTLDLTDDIYAAQVGSGPESLMLQAIANTYIENYSLDRLMITVDGETYESGHYLIDEYFTYQEF